MISNGSQLQVTDNSGAKVAQCINQSGKSWGIGDVITVSIKKAQPRSKVAAGQVRGRRRMTGGSMKRRVHQGSEARTKRERERLRMTSEFCGQMRFCGGHNGPKRQKPRPPLSLARCTRPPTANALTFPSFVKYIQIKTEKKTRIRSTRPSSPRRPRRRAAPTAVR